MANRAYFELISIDARDLFEKRAGSILASSSTARCSSGAHWSRQMPTGRRWRVWSVWMHRNPRNPSKWSSRSSRKRPKRWSISSSSGRT